MAELLKVFKAMTEYGDGDWNSLEDIHKVECFFIFNRYFTKMYPEKAQLLNDKEIDKVVAMDLWRLFIKSEKYPKNFWSKTSDVKIKLEKGEYTEKDIQLIINKLDIKIDEFNLLYNNHKDILDEELKYYKNLEKNDK